MTCLSARLRDGLNVEDVSRLAEPTDNQFRRCSLLLFPADLELGKLQDLVHSVGIELVNAFAQSLFDYLSRRFGARISQYQAIYIVHFDAEILA